MPVSIGRVLGHFEIVELLGKGGMGTVYRARDLELGREVALKVLPEDLRADPERLARFRREARLLAALSHPRIAAVFEVGEEEGILYLVMELARGETLARRFARGPLPIGEAVEIAARIAEGLTAAHEQGIIHRDLKPANVTVASDGTVKILDFGLAKALAAAAGKEGTSDLPTLSHVETRRGAVLGTPAYMSPEQARGEATDARTDVWGLGCLLFEMLAGARPFVGASSADLVAAVVAKEPPWSALPEETPALVRHLLHRCLTKEAGERLQAMRDVRILLDETLSADDGAAFPEKAGSRSAKPFARRTVGAIALAGAAALVVGLGVGWVLRPIPHASEGEALHLSIPAPEGTAFYLNPSNPGPAVISPDGDRVVFAAVESTGKTRLWVRELDDPEARPLPGTEEAQYPFWSPDGEWVGFFGPARLAKVAVTGTPEVIELADSIDGKGGSWSPQGVIVFAPGARGPLHRISADGGAIEPVTVVDRARHDSHRHPRFLPGGRQILYVARALPGSVETSALMLQSLDGGESKQLVESLGHGEYLSGRILYVEGTTLVARPFDPERAEWTGRPRTVVEGILVSSGAALTAFSASPNGRLVYQQATSGPATISLRDREGRRADVRGPTDTGLTLADSDGIGGFSPDGASVLLNRGRDLWTLDLASRRLTRLTFESAGALAGHFSPDGGSAVFSRHPNSNLFRIRVDAPGRAELLLDRPRYQVPCSWSPDGRNLLYNDFAEDGTWPLWVLPLQGPEKPWPFPVEDSNGPGAFSPDGRWLAYVAQSSGRSEVYVTSFPEPTKRWQASPEGGLAVWWPRRGGELIYQDLEGNLQAVPVELSSDAVELAQVRRLFSAPLPSETIELTVAPDPMGQRFLVREGGSARTGGTHVVLDWPALLEETGG